MNVRPSDAALVFLTAAMLAFFGLWQIGKLEDARDSSELNVLRAEGHVGRVDSAGWGVRHVEAPDGM